MIRLSILVLASSLQTAAAFAQTAAPAPAAPAPAPAPAVSTDMPGMTLAKFEARREKAFMAADTDADGKVSLAEWTVFQSKRSATGDPAKSFARMDANKDGFVDKTELDAFIAKRFAKLDKNGDGVLAADERPGHKTAPNQEQ